MTLRLLLAAFLLFAASNAFAQVSHEVTDEVARITASASYKAAMAALSADHDRIVADNIALTEVPAPPFKEAAKSKAFLDLLSKLGLEDVTTDAEGNVTGLRRGKARGPLLAVAAHLDTVFPEGTDVHVKRDGTILRAPGVGDDTRGLAIMLGIIRALGAAHVETEGDILFVASVGEEGLGDLRGMKYLFGKGPYKDRIKTFIAIDGLTPPAIMTTALGSKRYRVTFTGPGGHSYAAFGLVNPMYAMGSFLTEFAKTEVPALTTFNVGVVGGGTSVNSIPLEAWMEIDIRSVSPAEVDKVAARMNGLAESAAEAENSARSTKAGKIAVKIELIGDRPAGSTSHPFLGARQPAAAREPGNAQRNERLVEYAWAAAMREGMEPKLTTQSTDANIAMSLGIPAITLASGYGDRMHALDEWIDVDKEKSLHSAGLLMTTILAAAGLKQ
ncbi:MAG: M20/M25/M40 family metallo-hydrolase [Methylobacteriaceae bacterium]|nr:M20/M25/M40 family metallo-hydrolase [Methylobacteriaceae bacterium]